MTKTLGGERSWHEKSIENIEFSITMFCFLCRLRNLEDLLTSESDKTGKLNKEKTRKISKQASGSYNVLN